MSYRKLTIHDVTEIIGRWRGEQSARKIARETGLDRKTVRRYLAAAAGCSLPRDREPTNQELRQVAERVQTRPRPERSETWKQLIPHQERIAQALSGQKPLRLRGVHRTLQGEGVVVTYWMLRRFALQMRGEHRSEGASAAPSERRGAPSERRPAPSERRPAPSERRPAPSERRPAPSERHPQSPD